MNTERTAREIRMISRLAPIQWEQVDYERPRQRHPEVLNAVLRYDPRIVLFYDKRMNLYGIARSPERGGLPVLQDWWCEANQTYKPLSMELLSWLHQSDTRRRFENADEQDRNERADDDSRDAKQRRDLAGDIDHITRSHRRQLQKAKDLLRDISGRFVGP